MASAENRKANSLHGLYRHPDRVFASETGVAGQAHKQTWGRAHETVRYGLLMPAYNALLKSYASLPREGDINMGSTSNERSARFNGTRKRSCLPLAREKI